MKSFLYRPGLKAAAGVLCAIFLTAALLTGAGSMALLDAGALEGGDLYAALAGEAMESDASRIMYEYFDPSDPEHPWQSYYSGGIFTGENSNLRWSLTRSDTGRELLATWDGTEPLLYPTRRSFSMETYVPENTDSASLYQLEDAVFSFTGSLYGYDPEAMCFRILDDNTASYITEFSELPYEAAVTGFEYRGTCYLWDSAAQAFYPGENQAAGYSAVVTNYVLTMGLRSGLPAQDSYRELWRLGVLLSSLSPGLLWVCAGSLILGLALLVYLCLALCHVPGEEALRLCPLYRLPTDLSLALGLGLGLAGCVGMGECFYLARMGRSLYGALAGFAAGTGLAAAAGVYLILMLAARGKMGVLLSGTVLNWLFKNLRQLLRRLGHAMGRLLGYVPLLWKVGLCFLGLCLIELFLLMLFSAGGDAVLLWLLSRVVYGALIAYVTLAFHRLKTGAERIAAGDYTTPVAEKHLVLDFKDTADTLNHIQGGLSAAVDSRIRSERMKTELITNVSHDLKTPLTSIVSYVDLLKQEVARSQTVTAAAEEYLEVLDRQSGRMKKLIEDLVEASKASTGNLNLSLEPLDFCQLLRQALGEYSRRLSEANLTLMTKFPEEPVMIRADGRGLWRVFDNLLGNAVKYAMPGTRLYLTVETGTQVSATFRNISREPLDLTAGELMERFVRGDASRHTEGSGLGLSIAGSLTESMGGSFSLEVDGDLFKATVSFPVLQSLEAPESPQIPQ